MAHVVTGKARLSYPNLFKARASFAGQEAKYSCVLLIPKTDTATIRKIKEAVEVTKEESKDKWKGKIPANLRMPLRDGDVEKSDREEYAGMYFMSVSAKNAPKLYDREHNEILDADELYPGCWVRADINFAGYSQSGNNGIGAYVNSVMKWADAERFAGYSASADAYDDDYEDDDDMM